MKKILPALLLLAASATLPAQDFNTDVHTTPSPQTAERNKANAAMEAHDYELALKLLTPLAEANPKDAKLFYDLASAQDALDQNSAAARSYQAAIDDDPTFMDPHVALGLLLARQGKFDDAHSEFLAAIKLEGDLALKARAYRALARIDQKSHPEAAANDLLEALKLSPETPSDTLLAAELAGSNTASAGDAEAAYRRLLATHPDDPQISSALANLLIRQKRSSEAEPIVAGALAAHPGDPALTVQLASIYRSENRNPEALKLVEALHASEPSDENITHMLAGLYLQTSDYTQAEPLLAQLVARSPRNTTLADEYAQTLLHLKHFVEAEKVLAPLVAQPALFPTPADLGNAAGELAFACSQNNEPSAALQALQVRATVLPTSAPVLFLTAISHDKLHHTKQAQQAYKDFLAASNGSNPDEEFEARHRLVALEKSK